MNEMKKLYSYFLALIKKLFYYNVSSHPKLSEIPIIDRKKHPILPIIIEIKNNSENVINDVPLFNYDYKSGCPSLQYSGISNFTYDEILRNLASHNIPYGDICSIVTYRNTCKDYKQNNGILKAELTLLGGKKYSKGYRFVLCQYQIHNNILDLIGIKIPFLNGLQIYFDYIQPKSSIKFFIYVNPNKRDMTRLGESDLDLY